MEVQSVLVIASLACAQLGPSLGLDEAEQMRVRLLQTFLSIESIECDYSFCCNVRADYRQDNMEMRWKDGWLWYASRPDGASTSPDAHDLLMESMVGGNFSSYLDTPASGKSYHHTNYDEIRHMAYSELSPLSMLGVSGPFSYPAFSHSLRAFLEKTDRPLLKSREDGASLYLYPVPPGGDYSEDGSPTYGAIVRFDRQDRIVQVDYVVRPPCSLEETALYAGGHAPEDVYMRRFADIFEDYQDVDGYSLPMTLKRIEYLRRPDPEYIAIAARLYDGLEHGEMSACETIAGVLNAVLAYDIEGEWSVRIKPESVRINNPALSLADFQIVPPKEPTVTWDIASGEFVDEFGPGNLEDVRAASEAYRLARLRAMERVDYTIPAAAALLAVSLAILLTAVVLKAKAGQ